MNKRKMLSVIVPVVLGALVSGCGVEQNISINRDLSSQTTSKIYTTVEEESAVSESLDGASYEEVMKEMEYTYAGKEELNGKEHNVYQNIQKMSKKNTSDMFVTLTSTQAVLHMADLAETADETNEAQELEYAMLNVRYPFKVYKTNGKLMKDGYTVQYPLEKMMNVERLYAVSSAKYANEKNCTVSGVKNKGYYRKTKTVKAKSQGVITSFKVNNVSQETNSYQAKKDGTYTVKIKMLAGNTKNVKFVIDKTKPTTNIKEKTYKKKVKITFKDKTSGVKSATLNGKKIKSGKVVSKKGNYTLKITDKAGNVRAVKFSIQ